MDLQKGLPLFTKDSESAEEIIYHLETCYLCGSRLTFHHQTDYLNLQVVEEAQCSGCGVKSKIFQHTLQ